MATRMQQRKGTAAQWTSANPILNAGEIGWESDTNKFKIGDGTNHWADLDYFADINSTANPAFGSSITFEGTTANDYETVLQITDPTADRTITFPDASGTVALAANVAALSGATFTGAISGTSLSLSGNLTVQGSTTTIDSSTIQIQNSLVFEGATPNDFETTVQVTEPTQDNVITLQNATGVIPLRDTSDTFTNKSIAFGTNTITATLAELNTAVTDANIVSLDGAETLTNKTLTSPTISGLTLSDGSFVMEGATVNDFELTISAGNPTSDRTVTFQDITGTVALLTDIPSLTGYVTESGTQTLTNKTLTSPHVSNLIITDGSIVLEGSTPNDFETTVTFTDPTADRTITFPDLSGTVVTTGDAGSVTSTMILDGTILDADINASAAIAQSKISGLTTDLSNKQDKIAGVSDTEIGYLSAVTSDIQAQLDAKLALAGGTMTGAIAMGTSKITGLGTPTDAADAATKAYVDALGEGLHIHASVVAATTANITLATDVEDGDVLDGVTLATGNRILVKNQSTASENGIYVVAASGAPSRAADFDSPAEIDGGDFVFITGGTVNDNRGFVQINTVGTIGTDPIEFSQFSGAGTFTAGNGLTLTGPEFTINTSITADLSTAQTLTNKTLTSPKINLGFNAQTGTSYTLVLGDAGKVVTASNASAITVTIPPSGDVAYATGSQITVLQKGAGQVTFAQGSGVTINSTGATATAPKLRAQYSSATCVYEGGDVWYVVGDIS